VAIGDAEDDFLKIDRQWSQGDQITLDLPMQPRIVTDRETPFPNTKHDGSRIYHVRPLARRADANDPYATVYYGPLLMSLAIPDENPNKPMAGAKWNYALDVAPGKLAEQVEVTRHAMPEPWRWQLNGAPINLRIPAREFTWQPTGTQPLPKEPVTGGEATTITLVPYGCTKFRISMFPVSQRMWHGRAH